MNCLQCGKPANESGEIASGVKLRECADGHRTGQATAAMIKTSDALKRAATRAAKKATLHFVPKQKAA